MLLCLSMIGQTELWAQKKKKDKNSDKEKTESKEKSLINAGTLSGFKFRAIGPALTSGRISDFAVNPE